MTNSEVMLLGEQARQILNNPAWPKLVNMIQAMYWSEWRATAPADVDKRELLFTKALVVEDVLTALESAATAGRITAESKQKAGARPIL
jgi:hypothetical protein